MPLSPTEFERLKRASGLNNIRTLVAAVQGSRDSKGTHPIKIEVWDSGEGIHRYLVQGVDDNGRMIASSNPKGSISDAINDVSWRNVGG
jgi:hypothetical protein